MAKEKVTDYTTYPSKGLTALQERMVEWLQSDEVGADPSSCKSKQDAFELGVKLGVSLRIQFQKSDFNQEARSKDAAAREERLAEAAKNKKAGKKSKAAEESDDDTEDEEEEKPAKKATKKAAPAKKAAKKTAKKAADDSDDEDDEF